MKNYAMPPAVPAKKKRISPQGCTINPGDIVFRRITYRIGQGRAPEEDDGEVFSSVKDAVLHIATTKELASATYRIIEIPPGEPWDFDGTCVAELCCERGV